MIVKFSLLLKIVILSYIYNPNFIIVEKNIIEINSIYHFYTIDTFVGILNINEKTIAIYYRECVKSHKDKTLFSIKEGLHPIFIWEYG